MDILILGGALLLGVLFAKLAADEIYENFK